VPPASSYTFHTVTDDHSIAATFAITTTPSLPARVGRLDLTKGSVTVNDGANQAFTITPDANYHVAGVKVDGSSVGALTSYTFHDVAANHTSPPPSHRISNLRLLHLVPGRRLNRLGFSDYISIENPNTNSVHASITYMTGSGNVSGAPSPCPPLPRPP